MYTRKYLNPWYEKNKIRHQNKADNKTMSGEMGRTVLGLLTKVGKGDSLVFFLVAIYSGKTSYVEDIIFIQRVSKHFG